MTTTAMPGAAVAPERGPADEAREAANQGVTWAARIGYAAKGLIYLTVGFLSALAAFQFGGDGVSSGEAIRRLSGAWWGTATLVFLAVGLSGYVLWRMVQAFADPDEHGTDLEGLVTRATLLVSGLLYGMLLYTVLDLLFGIGGGAAGGGGGSNAELSQEVLQLPGGRWMVMLLGAAVIGRAITEAHKALSESYAEKLKMDLRREATTWALRLGRFGLTARALVFAVIGGFFVVAGWRNSSREAAGLDGALDLIREVGGPWTMAIVGFGLASYGAFQFVKAAYRRVPETLHEGGTR